MSYADLANAYASGNTVRHAFFVEFFFVSQTTRVWNGFRNIEIGSRLWQPVGPRGIISSGSIEDAISDQAPTITLSVSGVDANLLALAVSETDEIRGQLAFIYDCFFDETWQPYVDLETYAVAKMDTLHVVRKKNDDSSYDRTIEIAAQHMLTNGANPPAGRYSFPDQQYRYPNANDMYFEFMQQNQNRTQRWPTY